MTKSDALRVQDVRDAYRLIGECRDLGADPTLWHRRMLEGLCRLIGARTAAGGEGRWNRPHSPVQVISAVEVGLDAREHQLFLAYFRDAGPPDDPIFRALGRLRDQHVVRTRRQLVSDADWYGSSVWNDYQRLIGIDHQFTSVYQVAGTDAIDVIGLHRCVGERDFSPRAQRLMAFFHAEIGALIGRALVSAAEPSPDALAPRLRQTLACLLEGDSEKQAAVRLGLSQATTHEYVTALYRHFSVRSRAQLMAHAIKRLARNDWRALSAEGRSDRAEPQPPPEARSLPARPRRPDGPTR
jgi:DNA-binding CsgD family transcriptional regulator